MFIFIKISFNYKQYIKAWLHKQDLHLRFATGQRVMYNIGVMSIYLLPWGMLGYIHREDPVYIVLTRLSVSLYIHYCFKYNTHFHSIQKY